MANLRTSHDGSISALLLIARSQSRRIRGKCIGQYLLEHPHAARAVNRRATHAQRVSSDTVEAIVSGEQRAIPRLLRKLDQRFVVQAARPREIRDRTPELLLQ
jgi:hypothetical protein